VQLEDEILGEVFDTPPDDPSDTDGAHTVFVAGGVNTLHSRDLEVPDVVRVREGSEDGSVRLVVWQHGEARHTQRIHRKQHRRGSERSDQSPFRTSRVPRPSR